MGSMLYDNEKIKTLMVAAGLSGNQLAKKAGISGPSMHAILKGQTKNVRFATLAGIATALGVPIQAISSPKHKGKRSLQAEAANVFGQLNPDNQSAMLATMIHLAAQQKKT